MQSGVERETLGGPPFPINLTEGNMMAASSDAERVFERVKTQLKARLGGEVYSSWFGRMKLAEASRGVARLSVPTAFLKSWINGHYLDLIAELWRQEEPELLRVEVGYGFGELDRFGLKGKTHFFQGRLVSIL